MGAYSKYVNESADSAAGAAVRHYHKARRSSPLSHNTLLHSFRSFVRMDEMWWPRGEDDGSLLSQMTEDAAEAGAAVRHYHTTHRFILFEALSEWMKCGGLKIWGEGSVQVVHDRAPISQRAPQFAIITKLTPGQYQDAPHAPATSTNTYPQHQKDRESYHATRCHGKNEASS